jgi:hypothetical protein
MEVFMSADAKQAPRAFTEKRKPAFNGRHVRPHLRETGSR